MSLIPFDGRTVWMQPISKEASSRGDEQLEATELKLLSLTRNIGTLTALIADVHNKVIEQRGRIEKLEAAMFEQEEEG